MEVPKAPARLGAGGRRLWREVQTVVVLRHDEAVLLEKACRTLDDLDRLEVALAGASVLTIGSTGQERPNPLFGECRQARALLAALLKQLAIPDPEGEKVKAKGRSEKATRAARARWSA